MKKFLFLTLLVCSSQALAVGRIQNEDVKSLSDIQSSNGRATGNLSSISPCVSSLSFSSGSYAHLAVGLFVYDSTTPGNIGAGVTIAGLPGSCSAGQVQMSSNASGTATGDTITFGGQKSQLINDTKLYVSANSINDTLFNAITNGTIGSTLTRTINNQTGTTYTFVSGDGGSGRPILLVNNASGTDVTVPPHSSVPFVVGTQLDVVQTGVGRVTMHPGLGVTLNGAGSGRTIDMPYSLVSLLQTATDIWALIGQFSAFMTATGGTITTDGNFKVHTFTTSGTFQITAGSGPVDRLIIAGGGGATNNNGGGGGAGGYIYQTAIPMTVGSFPVTVGTGGPGGGTASPGNNSVFDGFTAIGGGASNSGNGGSGAGGTGSAHGTGTVGQGNDGGFGIDSPPFPRGGGGGCGAVGADAVGSTSGNGGNGCTNSITGTPVVYAGGGGGGVTTGGTPGNGGTGGGGNGSDTTGANGTSGLGGGGGGGGSVTGGSGGDGVVIIRYQFQ